MRVPVHVSGVAVVKSAQQEKASRDPGPVVAFLPAESLSKLRVGQKLFVKPDAGRRLTASVIAVDPEVSSPAALQRRFGLSDSAISKLKHPAVSVSARFETDADGQVVSGYLDSVFPADVEVESRRLISYLPLMGRFFGE